MKNSVKKLLRPFYHLLMKILGRDLQKKEQPKTPKHLITCPNCRVFVRNNKIIWELDTTPRESYALSIDHQTYPLKKGCAKFPLSDPFLSAFKNGRYTLLVSFPGEKASFSGKDIDAPFSKEYIKIDSKTYTVSSSSYIHLKLSKKGEDICVFLSPRNMTNEQRAALKLYIVDKSYHPLQLIDATCDTLTIQNADLLVCDNTKIQLVFLCGDVVFRAVSEPFDDNTIIVSSSFSRVYLSLNKTSFSYKTGGLDTVIPPLCEKYVNIDSVSYNPRTNSITIHMAENSDPDLEFVLYMLSLKTNERAFVMKTPATGEFLITDIDKMLDIDINQTDRYVLEFEFVDKNEKVVETNLLSINQPKTRCIENYILYSAHGNRLSFLNRKILTIESVDNHFTYPQEYDFDLENSTFSTDCSVTNAGNGKVALNVKIYSLLSRIAKFTIFLTDNYAKESYLVIEHTLNTPIRSVDYTFNIDMEKLKSILYYNARLNFHVGVEYVGGYRESDFLTKKRAKYSTSDRYLLEYPNDDLVTAFYLGPNLYNLNIWHSSKEEYDKGVNFQSAREKYTQTLQNEDVDNNLILFEANLGKNYTGNPKYLYEYMIGHDEYNAFKYVWSYPNTDTNDIPGNPIIAERGSEKYFYYLAKAKYWVNNILFPVKEKRDETIYLQTWHGTPLKKLGFDIECEGPEKQSFGNLYKESQNWDYLLADNDYGEAKLVGAFHFTGNVIKKGYPINDIFFDEALKSSAKKRLLDLYPDISGKKVILYAPTWRDQTGDYVRGYSFELPFNVKDLYDKLNGEYVFLVKLHHLVADDLKIPDEYSHFLLNVSSEEDVMELLCMTDILITDYSSVFYDFASAKKPILFYAYDMDEYINETRGLYVDMNTLPGPILKDSNDLVLALSNIDQYKYDSYEKLRAFCNEYGKYCNGHSRENVLNTVIGGRSND